MSIIISGIIVAIPIILRLVFPEIFSFLFEKGLDKVFDRIPNPVILLKKKRKKQFRQIIASPEYKKFVLEVLKRYYLFDKYGNIFSRKSMEDYFLLCASRASRVALRSLFRILIF